MRSLGFWFVGTVAPAAKSTRFVEETAVPLCSVVGFVRNLCAVVGSVWSRGPRCKVWKHYVFWIMFAHFAQLFFGYTFAPIAQRVAIPVTSNTMQCTSRFSKCLFLWMSLVQRNFLRRGIEVSAFELRCFCGEPCRQARVCVRTSLCEIRRHLLQLRFN